MKEFNKFVFGVWDRLRDNPIRKLEVNEKELELNERRRRAVRDTEHHELDMERKRYENRSLAAHVDLKQLGSFQEVYRLLSTAGNAGEFVRLMAIVNKGENTFHQ
jgi:hypothetical protein